MHDLQNEVAVSREFVVKNHIKTMMRRANIALLRFAIVVTSVQLYAYTALG